MSGQMLILTILPNIVYCGQRMPGRMDLGARQEQVREFLIRKDS